MKSLITCTMTILFFMRHFCVGQEICKNYYDEPGYCTSLDKCPSLKRLSGNLRSLSDRLILNGHKESCSNAKYCCADNEIVVRVKDQIKERAYNWTIVTPINPSVVITSSTASPSAGGGLEIVTPGPWNTIRTTTRPSTSKGSLPTPGSGECGIQMTDRIMGGSAATLSEYPWMARLESTYNDGRKEFKCGGFLINPSYVLTAAHCMPTPSCNFTITSVRLGEWNTATERDCIGVTCADPVKDIAVSYYTIYPDYEYERDFHDIALVRLATQVTYTNFIQPLCLPCTNELRSTKNYHDMEFMVSGWGETELAPSSNLKLKVALKGVGFEICKWIWRHNSNITTNQICAGGDLGQDSCHGDSGGPLMFHKTDGNGNNFYYAAGIVSFGAGCGKLNWPGVYTNIANYMDWIEATVRP